MTLTPPEHPKNQSLYEELISRKNGHGGDRVFYTDGRCVCAAHQSSAPPLGTSRARHSEKRDAAVARFALLTHALVLTSTRHPLSQLAQQPVFGGLQGWRV